MEKPNFKQSRMWLRENVFFIELDDQQVDKKILKILVDTNRRIHYTPNDSAAFLLRFLVNDGGVHFNDLKQALIEQYSLAELAGEDELERALEGFFYQQILGVQEVREYTPVPLLALQAEEFAKLGEKPPPPALEGWAEARLVQGGTLLSLGRVPFVKNVYTG